MQITSACGGGHIPDENFVADYLHTGDIVMNAVTHNPDALVQPRQILVATDLCDSNYLLPIAIAQAKATGGHLTLVHAFINPAIAAVSAQGLVPPDGGMDAEEFAERILAELVKRARAEGVTCDSIVRQGFSAAEALRDEVHRTGAERVIMGTHGRGRVGQLVLGSVAKSLLRSLEIPIFAVGPQVRAPEAFATPRRILHPVSLHGYYRENVDVARRLAEFYQAELILMHSIEPDAREGNATVRDLNWAKRQLDASMDDPATLTVDWKTHVAYGEVIGEILESAAQFEADWIVLGWNEKRRNPAFTESAAYRVMAGAAMPVLTLPHHLPHPGAQTQEKPEGAVARQ
ncbi:MAG: universal stress protein [Acidobacteriaceae bacterium]